VLLISGTELLLEGSRGKLVYIVSISSEDEHEFGAFVK
jgi:hypothetical protein